MAPRRRTTAGRSQRGSARPASIVARKATRPVKSGSAAVAEAQTLAHARTQAVGADQEIGAVGNRDRAALQADRDLVALGSQGPRTSRPVSNRHSPAAGRPRPGQSAGRRDESPDRARASGARRRRAADASSSRSSEPRNTRIESGTVATARTLSSAPSRARTLVAFGVSCRPAPNSSSRSARSYSVTSKPACDSARAVESPPMPAPAMIARRPTRHAASRHSHSAGSHRRPSVASWTKRVEQ